MDIVPFDSEPKDRRAAVVFSGENFAGEKVDRNLIEVCEEGSGVQRGVSVVVADKEQIGGELIARDEIDLARLCGGVDDAEAAFAR